jgi:hypothetical protein
VGVFNPFLGGVSSGGHSAGNTGTNAAALILVGGNNITLSQDSSGGGATVTIIGAAGGTGGGGGSFIGGVSGGNTLGISGTNSLALVLAGGNNITLSQATDSNGNSVTISGATQSAESNSFGISNLGNTAGISGTIASNQARLLLAGGNNITLSQSIAGGSATITISAANTLAQSVQTLGLFGVGNTTGQSSSSTVDARSLSFDGAGIASVGMSGGSVIISVPAGGGGGDGFNILSLGGNTAGVLTMFLSATVNLAGGNNITLSQTSNSVTISAANQSNQSGALFAGAQSFGTSSGTFDARTLSLAGSGAVSVAASNSGFIISAPVQTAASNSFGISNLGNTAGTSGTMAANQARLLFAGGNNITLSQSIAGASATITISGANPVAQSNQTLGLFAASNTTQSSSGTVDARSLTFAGAGIASVGVSNGSVVVSVPSGGGGGDGFNIIEISGNTTGTTASFLSATLALAGGPSITLSQSSNSISINAPAVSNLTGIGMVSLSSNGSTVSIQGSGNILSASGNTTGTLATFSSGTVVLAGGNNVTLSQSSNSISIHGPVLSYWEPREFNHHISFQSLGQNSLWFFPLQLPAAISISRLNMVLSLSCATGATASEQVGLTQSIALYSRAAGTSQSLSQIFSTSHTARQSANSNASWLVNWNGNSAISVGVALSGAMTGQKIQTFPMATFLSAGEYWLAFAMSTSSVGSSVALQVSHAVITGITNNSFGYPGFTLSSAATLNPMIEPMGTYSATSGAFPATVHVSQVNGMSSQDIPYFNFANFGTA